MNHISIYGDAIKVDIQTRYNEFSMAQHLNNVAYFNYIEIAKVESFTKVVGVDFKKNICNRRKYENRFYKTDIFW